MTYDAVLVLSFGGPDGPDDVLPFLENVVRGRGVPRDRLLAVAEHYQHFGGVSPINAANRELVTNLTAALVQADLSLPVYWGNRNWYPLVEDTVAEMATAGVRRALVFATSAYASYSACRQYIQDIDRARSAVGESAPALHKLRQFFDHPGFIEPQRDALRAAVAEMDADRRRSTAIVFTAHSVPTVMAERSGPAADGLYVRQLQTASGLIASAEPELPWQLAWQSRSGPPSVPWLEPDINDQLRVLATQGVTDVVVVPVGFVSDHVEVLWDLDNEAMETAESVGLALHRTQTAGTDPRFVEMVVELIAERQRGGPARALSALGPAHEWCPVGCCPSGRPALTSPA